MKKLFAILSVAALAANLQAGTITVKGSDTLVVLAQKWAEVYMGEHKDTKIQVSGGGTGTGFAALQNQTTDLCDASRKAKAAEIANCIKVFNGKRPTEYKVALDGLSVYVNPENPVKELTLDQVKDIFTGKIKNWKAVGGADAPITVYSRENSSGTYEFFKEHVLKGSDFAASAQTQQGTALIVQSVVKDKNAIGYGGAAYGGGSKLLAIKKDENSPAVAPSEETVVNQSYPIWRYLYVYLDPSKDKGEVAAYLNWMRSDAGQKYVTEVGYYPLQKNFRSN
ncbi:MAG: phosphate transporter periplasmic phosphate-binding protein [Verrucomicrobiota bacterium]|jgi:phosphate transport system substrate-binding protein